MLTIDDRPVRFVELNMLSKSYYLGSYIVIKKKYEIVGMLNLLAGSGKVHLGMAMTNHTINSYVNCYVMHMIVIPDE